MKYINILLINLTVLIIILAGSCKKNDVNHKLDDYILAGQKDGVGIHYVDVEPDINFTIIDPWHKTDTIIDLDLNNDGIADFSLKGTMCHPSQLGGDCEDVSIIPLLNNEVSINPITTWLDTIPYNDTIDVGNHWTNDETLLYSYLMIIPDDISTKGYWHNVYLVSSYYIGFKIIEDDKPFYGWIGMKNDSTSRGFNFQITDYAILKEYVE